MTRDLILGGFIPRQLSWYQFQRIRKGADKGAFFHKYFLRGRPDLITLMVRSQRPRPSNITAFKRKKRSSRLIPDLYTFSDCPELQDAPELCEKVKESLTEMAVHRHSSISSELVAPEPIKILDKQYSSSCVDHDDKPPVLAFEDEDPPSPADCRMTTAYGGEEELSSMESDLWLQPRKVFAFDGPVGFVGVYNEQKQTYDITWP